MLVMYIIEPDIYALVLILGLSVKLTVHSDICRLSSEVLVLMDRK